MRRVLLLVALFCIGAGRAGASTDLFSPRVFKGHIDLRGAVFDGERSWLSQGLGKTRFGSANGNLATRWTVAEAALVWQPRLMTSVTGHVHLQAAPHQGPALGPVEGYIKWRPVPRSPTRYIFRAGLMFPPVSLENDGTAWSTPRTITPSAINTWIGEEVAVIGLEGAVRRKFARHELQLTAAMFGFNDTSGALLAFRGWGLHDQKTIANGSLPLPELGATWHVTLKQQAPRTEPTREADDQPGFYARIDWRPPARVAFNIFAYDNRGDNMSVDDGQYAWATRFIDVGMQAALSEKTLLLSQAMIGKSSMGPRIPGGRAVDYAFDSAYVLVTHSMGKSLVSGRAEYFETRDRTLQAIDNNAESGWALTAAYKYRLRKHVGLAFELQHISSDRAQRAVVGVRPQQSQTLFQANLRIGL